ncbi:enoyl-CoA hydratase/isomerase family protein [Conexibacter sp. SYSU D00693]|uniref:enoyl-CoA hydratase/isomerase family protein n=1 Tax=Conexibacter sp. SYSU D00693 TaxID=2812560 RepID=UPI00196A2C83|nr:enoyl-CoA hydratase/isomerase family protein [Conexibacter sp. SYSU D00693]
MTDTAPLYATMRAAGAGATHEAVRVQRRGDRATVTLAEPRRLNALSAALMVQLRAALEDLAADEAIRAIVLTGEDPGFSAGGDLEMMGAATARLCDPEDELGTTDVWRWIRREFGGVVRTIARTDKAFVAALNGPAAGVGLAFALTCDVAVASDRAVIVPAFGRLGLLPEVGTSWALTRALGYQGAFAFFAEGRHLDAQEAHRRGLVQEVVAHDELAAAAERWCDRVCALAPHALEMAKPLLRAAADAPWDHALALEEYAEPTCFTTARFRTAVDELRGR